MRQCLSSTNLLSRLSSTELQQQHDELVDNSHADRIENRTKLDNDTNLKSLTTNAGDNNRTALATNTSTRSINSIRDHLFLKQNDFWNICPILLYQLASPNALEHSGCLDPASVPLNAHLHQHAFGVDGEENRTWGNVLC